MNLAAALAELGDVEVQKLTKRRRGEVAGLRWSDIDLDARTLQISSTWLRFGKHLVEGTPKSRAGRMTCQSP